MHPCVLLLLRTIKNNFFVVKDFLSSYSLSLFIFYPPLSSRGERKLEGVRNDLLNRQQRKIARSLRMRKI